MTNVVPRQPPAPFEVHRPWGSFQQFVANEPVTVKIITVSPGQRLSLQKHAHRDEFWQVLDGTLTTEVDGFESTVAAGQQVWVPVGGVHRMGNTTGRDVRVLEIAFGTFDEDDIERLEDDYARVGSP